MKFSQAQNISNFLALGLSVMDEAKTKLYLAFTFSSGAVILGVVSIFIPKTIDYKWELGIIVAALFSAILSLFFYRKFEDKYNIGSEAKRFALLEEGLGWKIPTRVITEINNRAGNYARKKAKNIDVTNYYASERKPGGARLLDHLRESAFFTYNLYHSLQQVIGACLLISFSSLLLIGWFYLVSPQQHDIRIIIGKFIIIAISTFVSTNLISWFFKLGDLHKQIESIFKESEITKTTAEREIMRLVGEYNCQLGQGMIIPGWLYRKNRDYLNEVWEERKKGFAK